MIDISGNTGVHGPNSCWYYNFLCAHNATVLDRKHQFLDYCDKGIFV